ncbi:aspartate kinase [Paenibacillus sp. IB182496]|uniref:Aspartokinase n=1 Tax=Paenibacillus sabuli TaxID=2772509 RepID=A0A927BR60_9BACL|nr:aspartate kinase [Paenibacillus sabuli]MBD2845231.1 aspartate kinase [Paenibacillus sabuli]
MRILVQKFGGTSLSGREARAHVVGHIARERQAGARLAVVVSAMGRGGDPYATDTLLGLPGDAVSFLPLRERDLLLACGEVISAAVLCAALLQQGVPAVVLNGGQAGIATDGMFGNARIMRVDPEPVLRHLEEEQVVIVTGFQGVDKQGETTTLGRGGSDTTATALGAALQAQRVDIYTDVDGILTADPRIVPNARPLVLVSYGEICNMARQGAKVIHPRAVEIAQQAGIPLRVRSTFSDNEGTLVTHRASGVPLEGVVDRPVTGIAHVAGVTQLSVQAQDGNNDVQLQVFQAMAGAQISVDFINVTPSGVVYTVFDADAPKAQQILRALGYVPQAVGGCAKVSVIGGGMNGVPGIMARIVEALAEQDITILQSADSNSTIWVLVREPDMQGALRALHAKFQLDKI